MKYFESIFELPVFNWHKLSTDNDLNYLLKLDSYTDIPTHNIDLNKVYEGIIRELPHADTILQKQWIEAKKLYILFLSGSNKISQIHSKFTAYRNHLDTIYHKFVFDDKVYKTSRELFSYIRELANDKNELIHLMYTVFDMQHINAEIKSKGDIMREMAVLSSIYRTYLDPKTVSLGMYYSLRSEATKLGRNKK